MKTMNGKTRVKNRKREEVVDVIRLQPTLLLEATEAVGIKNLARLAKELYVAGIDVSYETLRNWSLGKTKPDYDIWENVLDWFEERLPKEWRSHNCVAA